MHDYHERFGLDFTVLRFGSLYGPRADRSNGVHNLLAQALAERASTITAPAMKSANISMFSTPPA